MEAYGHLGDKVWTCELEAYGKVKKHTGDECFIPFRFQGQYHDSETGLYYNRFRYYAPDEGMYVSQDPTRLNGGNKFYDYVHDTNIWVDILALAPVNPSSVLFSQNDIAPNFSDGSSINQLVGRLINDPEYINQVEPIRKVRMKDLPEDLQTKLKSQGAHDLSVFTLDNRRLHAAQKAKVGKIPSRWATKEELGEIDLHRRFSTVNGGKKIDVRC